MNVQITLIFISILLVTMFGLLIWVIRMVLNKQQLVKQQPVQPQKTPLPVYSESIKPKYAHSKLQNAEKQRLLKKIIEQVEQNKSYRQPNLTISRLAEELELPKHYLSQIINEQLGISFIDFINRYRVVEAKAKLQDERLNALSMLAIGYQVGFKSKSTFYAAFKKYTKQTPAAFRRTKLLDEKNDANRIRGSL